ncbi:MAG: 16S rRNA (cytosine(1402)-N(4))-methyltransferase RsmH [Candidatus Zambryskibacteria bacterium]|nr:16S rRNA (cytosine(1402)-N(4))-methyltransferase RsmH [Candidatus Zambryskibacteria bacterium]
MTHKSVLLKESIDGLEIKSGDIFVDGTLGGGGHTEEVCNRFCSAVVMIGIDLDPEAISRATARLSKECNFQTVQGSFRNIDALVSSLGFPKVDKILLDIGPSSNQFEDSGRGFSFQKDEPLIMSFKKELKDEDLTAREIVNTWEQENIQAILEGYGEEQFAWKISRAIVERRSVKPILTTFELVDIVKSATPKFYHHRKIHPATKTFQALRITVNDEIESLKEGLRKGFETLNSNGRIGVISFHSLEDRVVKQFFRELEDAGDGKRITKKPILPTDDEVIENPRSRSAKLRILEKIS